MTGPGMEESGGALAPSRRRRVPSIEIKARSLCKPIGAGASSRKGSDVL